MPWTRRPMHPTLFRDPCQTFCRKIYNTAISRMFVCQLPHNFGCHWPCTTSESTFSIINWCRFELCSRFFESQPSPCSAPQVSSFLSLSQASWLQRLWLLNLLRRRWMRRARLLVKERRPFGISKFQWFIIRKRPGSGALERPRTSHTRHACVGSGSSRVGAQRHGN